jgi:two-component system, OmpR family, sensor kinase
VSLRMRLALLYGGVVALVLVTASVALYVAQSRVTLEATRRTLATKAERIAAVQRPALQLGRAATTPLALPGTYAQLTDPSGAVITRTAALGALALPLSDAGRTAVGGGAAWSEIAPVDGERMLVHSLPLVAEGRRLGTVQVALSLASRDAALASLRGLMVVVCIVSVVATLLGGWLLASNALEPIRRIARTARAIGDTGDFARRVPYSGPDDEVGQLSTTLNQMLADLAEAHRQTEQALGAQRRFVADAAHELRTPLTTIRGNIGLLQLEPPLDATDRTAILRDMEDETDRLAHLVHDLLSLARADSAQVRPTVPTPIGPLLADLCRQARRLAPERQITCRDATAGLAALADRDEIKQVLLILLDNALRHTPTTAAIAIEASTSAAQVYLRVADTGPGIDSALIPDLFERFRRGSPSRTGTGTGLGLAIARAVVEARGGAITAANAPGAGAVFTVTLPATPVATVGDDDPV